MTSKRSTPECTSMSSLRRSHHHQQQQTTTTTTTTKKNSLDRSTISTLGWFILLSTIAFVSRSSFGGNDGTSVSTVFPPITTYYVSAFQQIQIPIRSAATTASRSFIALAAAADDDDNNEDLEVVSSSSPSSSLSFALSPTSDTAKRIVMENLGLSSEQFQQLEKLAVLVDDWNSRINLISRKDCSVDVVFGRHILPSLAPLAALMVWSSSELDNDGDDDADADEHEHGALLKLSPGDRVCDVGTGGGFPGLPLAIARPDVEFLLVDSVGKKITAVQDMVDQLGLKNVKTYHGRAESISGQFNWVVGRSVSALPTYCFWVHHLLQKNDKNARLVYLIGGEIDEDILEEAILDEEISDLFDVPDISDKRVLVFPKTAVDFLAEVSGETLRVPKRGAAGNDGRGNSKRQQRNNNKKKDSNNTNAKGQWTKRDNSSTSKQRGYSGFKRFDSLEN